MSKLRALWRNGRGMLFVVLVGIAFYEMLEHFSSVRAVISRTTSVLMPILCGLMVAYIINIPATILQGTLFKKAHAAGKKYVVPLTVVLSYLIVFGILTAVLVIVIPKAADSVKILFDNRDAEGLQLCRTQTGRQRRADVSAGGADNRRNPRFL